MIVYDVDSLCKIYPGQAVPANNNISFQVCEGEIFGILGDNGAGKTTLIKQMVNLLGSTSGSILLYGKPVTHDSLYLPSLVGYMPQESHALNQLTAGEALYYSAHLRGMNRSAAIDERNRLLKFWKMEDLRDQYSSRLSGGQRRLLRLAVATAASSKVLVLDEPTNDLDPQKRRLVWENLRVLNRDRGKTIIFITHDAVEAERVIERVGILHRGKLVITGSPHVLKRNLKNKLRLEIAFEPGQAPPLPADLELHRLTATRWQIYLEQHQLGDVIAALDIDRLTDMKLSSATLEDLYFHYVEAV
ncbi:MAG: ABC transporter ATP-binding protein [Chloroflexi bacterium]|nr:ABC transporter ATP-binding protein [Chloroflexota bacterium]